MNMRADQQVPRAGCTQHRGRERLHTIEAAKVGGGQALDNREESRARPGEGGGHWRRGGTMYST